MGETAITDFRTRTCFLFYEHNLHTRQCYQIMNPFTRGSSPRELGELLKDGKQGDPGV